MDYKMCGVVFVHNGKAVVALPNGDVSDAYELEKFSIIDRYES
jgi:hypothetical protein